MRYLLDTCIISELAAKQPNPQVVAWIKSTDPEELYLSVITIGEILKGVEKLAESKRKRELRIWLEEDLLARFRDNLVALDVDVLMTWGRLTARLETGGRRMPVIDSLLAVSALHGGFTLVTRNEADFEGTGVSLHNPWK